MLRVTKSVLRKLNDAAGKLDADSGSVFLGFVGRLEMSDRLYHGELRYSDVGDDPPRDTVSISEIMSPVSVKVDLSPKKPTKTKKTEE